MIINITDIQDPRVLAYVGLTEAQLRNRLHPDEGLFIAESPKVISVALDAGYQPVSMLTEERHIIGDAREIIRRIGDDVPVYTGTRELLAQLTGYTLTRGVLCAMRRPQPPSLDDVLKDARRIVIMDGVVDSTNIGSMFRSAAALGIDAALVTNTSCDPFNRRAIRVSMGSVFLIPWTTIPSDSITETMHNYGFQTIAMALRKDSIAIDDAKLKQQERLALIMGNEGDGLPQETIDCADYIVRIPMFHNVDSLNVAAASAIAFWELRKV